MKHLAYCVFETPLGVCGIAWREPENSSAPPAVTLLQLPEETPRMTESRIARSTGARQPSAPPPRIAAVIEKVCKHLRGELQDFRDVPVDLEGVDAFARHVYEAAREIPPGQTRTYGDLAKALSQQAPAPSASASAAQAVGQVLARNPIPIIIPCHRVLASGGKSGGFSAPGGRTTKARLLAIEGSASGLLPLDQTIFQSRGSK